MPFRVAGYSPQIIYPDVPLMDLETYEKATSRFIERLLDGFRGDIGIYRFGKISTPGVSDIDLLVTTRDADWKTLTLRARSIIGSTGLFRYLFIHEPVTVSESILPYLAQLHTLKNCHFLWGNWDPLAHMSLDDGQVSVRTMQHITWNSSIRIAALELDNGVIGLRRVLLLMNNLLHSTYSGNSLLAEPLPLTLTSEEIRTCILSASPWEQETLAKDYLRQVLAALDDVDEHLNQQFFSSSGVSASQLSLIVASRYRLIIPAHVTLQQGLRWYDRPLRNVQVVRVPAYLIVAVAALARSLGAEYLRLAEFYNLSVPESVLQAFDTRLFAEHLKQVSREAQKAGVNVDFYFPTPFSFHEPLPSPRKQFVRWARKTLLAQKLRKPL